MHSILGIDTDRHDIRENVEERYFDFDVEWDSKPTHSINTQRNHCQLFRDARILKALPDSKIYDGLEFNWPFGKKDSSITSAYLVQDGKDGVLVYTTMPINMAQYISRESSDKINLLLGCVPQIITKQVVENFDQLKHGWIRSCKIKFSKKSVLCSTRVAIPWTVKYVDTGLRNRLAHGWDDE